MKAQVVKSYRHSSVKITSSLLLFICVLSVSSCLSKMYGDATVARVVRVYDGDTLTVDIQDFTVGTKDKKRVIEDVHPIISEAMSIRVYGIDTPEIKSKSEKVKAWAIKARDRARELLDAGKKIVLKQIEKDKYFRFDAIVLIDGISLGDVLIEEGLAVAYDGGKKSDWEAILADKKD